MQLDVTTTELLAVIQAVEGGRDANEPLAGFTRAELQEQTGWGVPKTLKHIKKCISIGLVEPKYLARKNMFGEWGTVKGYDLTTNSGSV